VDLHRRQALRSLDLHREAVRVLENHAEHAQRALEVLTRWETQEDGCSKPILRQWRQIIKSAQWELAHEDSDRGQQLRQSSPLVSCWNQLPIRGDAPPTSRLAGFLV
jgi:hypothetical protein